MFFAESELEPTETISYWRRPCPIQHIVYINLDKRTDRRAHMEKVIEEYGWADIAQRFPAIPFPGFGIYGCGMSHLSVLKMARDANWEHVLILEDDFLPLIGPEEMHMFLCQLFDSPWFYCDVFMLSYSMNAAADLINVHSGMGFNHAGKAFAPFNVGPEAGTNHRTDVDVDLQNGNLQDGDLVDPTYQRVLFAQTASGYLVKRHYYDKLIALYEDAMPKLLATGEHWHYANDVVWKPLQESDLWIAPKQRWGKQMDGYSDNSECFQSYNA